MTDKAKKLFFMHSAVVYITVLLIAYFFKLSGPLSIFILFSKLFVYIASLFLMIRILYLIKKKHAFLWQLSAFIITLFLIVFSAILFPLFSPPSEKTLTRMCMSNLKQYYISLNQYAADNRGYFPPGNDEHGLNTLEVEGYIASQLNCWGKCDFSTFNLSSEKAPDNTYRYYGGHHIQDSPAVIIMEDKQGNHRNGDKVVLYSDGRIMVNKE